MKHLFLALLLPLCALAQTNVQKNSSQVITNGPVTFGSGNTLTAVTGATVNFTGATQHGIIADDLPYTGITGVPAVSLLGNATGSVADAEAITLAGDLKFTGTVLDTIQPILTSSSPTFGGLTLNGLGVMAGGISITGGTAGAARITHDSTTGVSIRAGSGSVNDFALVSTGGTVILDIPVGLNTLSIPVATTISSPSAIMGTPTTTIALSIAPSGLTSNLQTGIASIPTMNTAATAGGYAGYFQNNTVASAFTIGSLIGIGIASPTIGAGSTATNVIGLSIANQTGGGTNKAIATGSGIVTLGDTTEASGTAGSVTLAGGEYIAKKLIVGGTVAASNLILGGILTTSGAFNSTFTMTGNTAVTFPTSGTLATTAGTVSTVQGTAGWLTPTTATAGAVTLAPPAAIFGVTSLGINTGTTPAAAVLQVVDTGTSNPRGIFGDQYNTGTNSAQFNLRKARGTFASPTTIVTGDVLGRVLAWGYDGANFIESANLRFLSTGTVAATRVPSQAEIWTGTDALPTVLTRAVYWDAAQNEHVIGTVSASNLVLTGTLTTAGNLTTSGAFSTTFTMTGNTGVTFPTSGTLATTAGTVSTITGTANQIAVTGTTAPTLSLAGPHNFTTQTANNILIGNGSSAISSGGMTLTTGSVLTAATTVPLTLRTLDSNANIYLNPNGTGNVAIGQESSAPNRLYVTGSAADYIVKVFNSNASGTGNGLTIDTNSTSGTDNFPLNVSSNGVSKFQVREDGVVLVAGNVASISTTTGAFTDAGGAGFVGNVFAGGLNAVTSRSTMGLSGSAQTAIESNETLQLYGSSTSYLRVQGSTTTTGIFGADSSGPAVFVGSYTNTPFALRQNNVARVTIGATTGDTAFSSTTDATTGGAGSVNTAGGIYAAKQIISGTTITAAGTGGFVTSTIGGTLSVKTGTNAKAGTFTLTAGVATVTNTSITTHSSIHASLQAGGISGTITGPIYFPTVTAATGFTVAETGGVTDNSTYVYWIEENN